MEEQSRTQIEELVRQAMLAFYDESAKAEAASRVDVDYVTQKGGGHKMMVFAPDHEFEEERPVWADFGELTLHLEPEKVGVSSYHVVVTICKSG